MSWFWNYQPTSGLLVASLVVSAFFAIRHWGQIRKFAGEVQVELVKCNWPWDPEATGLRRYKELIDSTILVVVAMTVLGAYTGMFDLLLGRAVSFLVGLGL